jgi:hypothetical protein
MKANISHSNNYLLLYVILSRWIAGMSIKMFHPTNAD